MIKDVIIQHSGVKYVRDELALGEIDSLAKARPPAR
jgi:hypothetical protein